MRRDRPNADDLLRKVQEQEVRSTRGHLKVFLGASAGVGKTYSMLSEAREQKSRGVDVVVGYAESHRRADTDALLEGLEILPRKELNHRGVSLSEFDLDAALSRKPALILVDEFAHTNAPGSRHPKRYQDVEELIRNGIDVYTTVNIQHLESLNDVVAQITGVMVRETIPDSVLERADEIELVDIPPAELRQRVREGKVYVPDRIDHALEGFFREGNLIALRELALRRAADRVDAQMQSYRAEQKVSGIWRAKERLLVCIAPNRLALRVVRSAARIAAATHADMVAISVESDRQTNRSADESRSSQEALQLAERLGMETTTTSGHDIVGEIIREARERNVSLIVVGKPIKPRWKELLQGSVVDELVRRSGDIDVHVITGEEEANGRAKVQKRVERQGWHGYAAAVVIAAVATCICFLLERYLSPANLIFIYLAGAALLSSRFGRREAILISLLSVACYDFFFVPPKYTFAVADTQYLLTFAIMLAISLLISDLSARLRQQASLWQAREERSAALYRMSRDLAKTRSTREIGVTAAKEIGEVFKGDACVLLQNEHELAVLAKSKSNFEFSPSEQAAANWTAEKGELAGAGTDTLPNAAALYVPLVATRGVIGVIGLKSPVRLDSQQEGLLLTFANGLALAFERTLLAKESHQARLAAETEKMRNVLLNSVSHDLRTPLTVIHGAASSIAAGTGNIEALAAEIVEQSDRLNRHVQNLLDMTRLEASEVKPNLDWESVEELVGTALAQTEAVLTGRKIEVDLPEEMPLVQLDRMLIEKALINLLENVAVHTPPGSPVKVRTTIAEQKLRLIVEDRGPGVAVADRDAIFEKFHRSTAAGDGGYGLGLAICRSIAEAHGGRAFVESRAGGGSSFILELPASGHAPEVAQ